MLVTSEYFQWSKVFQLGNGVRVGVRWLKEYFGIYDVCQRVLYDIQGYVELWCSRGFLVVLGCCVVAEAQCSNGSHRVSRCV